MFEKKAVTWNGVTYESLGKCAEANGVSYDAMRMRLSRNKNCDKDVRPNTLKKEVRLEGIKFSTLSEAARCYQCTSASIAYWLLKDDPDNLAAHYRAKKGLSIKDVTPIIRVDIPINIVSEDEDASMNELVLEEQIRVSEEQRLERYRNRPDPSLYLVGSDVGLTKIGLATNVPARVSDMQVGSPSILTLLFMYTTPLAYTVESILHKKYRDKNTHGEWFRLSDVDIEWIKNNVANVDMSLKKENEVDTSRAA